MIKKKKKRYSPQKKEAVKKLLSALEYPLLRQMYVEEGRDQIYVDKSEEEKTKRLENHEKWLRMMAENDLPIIYIGDVVQVKDIWWNLRKRQLGEQKIGTVLDVSEGLGAVQQLHYTLITPTGERFVAYYNELTRVHRANGYQLLEKLLQDQKTRSSEHSAELQRTREDNYVLTELLSIADEEIADSKKKNN